MTCNDIAPSGAGADIDQIRQQLCAVTAPRLSCDGRVSRSPCSTQNREPSKMIEDFPAPTAIPSRCMITVRSRFPGFFGLVGLRPDQ
jgi:hypothetical protein